MIEFSNTIRIGSDGYAITKSGSTPSRKDANNYQGDIPWLKSGELGDCDVWGAEEQITQSAMETTSLQQLPPNTVLVAMYGATAGKTGILRAPSCINQAICSIRPINNSFNPRFMQLFFVYERPALLSKRYGGAQPNLNQSIIRNVEVPNLPLSEQKKIAAVLLKIQRAIETQDKIINSLRDLKKSTMQHLFTHGLHDEKTKKTEIGEIPESWQMVNIAALVDSGVLDKPLDGNHGNIHPKASEYVPKGIPFVMASDLENGTINFETCKYLTKERADKLQKGFSVSGDILISHKGTIGRTAVVPLVEHYVMLTPQVTYYRVLDRSLLDPVFLRYFMDSDLFQRPFRKVAGDGATRAYIGITKQLEQQIAVPGIDEQKHLASVATLTERDLNLAIARKAALQDLFKTTLNKLMTGDIRVGDLDIDVKEVEV